MEFSQVFGFLKIWSEAIKIFFKNGKLIASIAALSLLLSTVLFFLYNFAVQFTITYMTNSTGDSSNSFLHIAIFAVLFFSVELTFLYIYIAISRAAGIAAVITTATSYTGAGLSLRDLFSAVKSKWRNPFSRSYRRSGNRIHYLWIVAVVVAIPVVMHYPNPVTIAIVSVLVVTGFAFMLYASTAAVVASVISVVEDGCEAAEAVERAEKLVEGRRLDGFMVHLFPWVVGLIVCLGYWMIVGDKGRLNLPVYGVFFVDCAIAVTTLLGGVHTVYYFQCREYHGEEIQPFGNYATLPSDNIP